MDKCPDDMGEKNYFCIEKRDECTLVESDIYLKKDEDFKFIKTLAKAYLNEFNYTKKHISLYTQKDFSIILYKDRRCVEETSLSMPKIDFRDCYTRVQSEYKIREELLISILDQKGTNGASPIFKFYHPISGEELNHTKVCRNTQIAIKENVSAILDSENNTNYELQMSLIDQGIDLFNLDSPFYKDLCFDFDNPEDKDLPLSMRLEKAFPNAVLCEPGCKTNGIQLPEKIAICDCSMNELANQGFIKDNALLEGAMGEVLDLINSSNIMVVTCYKYIFKYFTRSIGGIIATVLLIGQILCTIFYFIFGLPKLKIYILTLTENYLSYLNSVKNKTESAPPRRSLKNSLFDNKINKTKKQVKIDPAAKVERKIKKRKEQRHFDTGNDLIKREKMKEKNHGGSPLLTSTKLKLVGNSNDILISLKKNKEQKNKLMLIDDKNININLNTDKKTSFDSKDAKNKENKKFFEEYMSTYPDDMEFDDAISKDKRKFSECLVENLKQKQMVAFTFFADDPIKIRIMKLMLFILNIILYFVITGIFFNEEYIVELYKINDEDENFFSYIPRFIDKIIYTTLVSIIIGYIVELFFVDEKKIKGIFKREKDIIINLKKEVIQFTKSLQKSYIAFIIFVFIILLISFYYLLCFNYVYPKTQNEWIKCSITIIIIMQLLSLLNCLLITCLRFLSFKLKSPKIYKVSKLLD